MTQITGTILVALAGIVFGGVLNAFIDRWTAREDLEASPITCRKCGESFDLPKTGAQSSWFKLRCRCPHCGACSAWRYALVALAVGATWAAAAWQALGVLSLPGWEDASVFDSLAFGVVRMILCWLLIGLAVMDAENRWLPDWFTLGGAALGVIVSFCRFGVYWVWHSLPLHWSFEGSFGNRGQYLFDVILRWSIGLIVLPVIVLLVRWSYQRIRNQEGTRVGEAKLMLMIAAWLGLSHALLAFVIGILLAAVAVLVRVMRKGTAIAWMRGIPLGSFFCVGGILSGLWGRILIDAYLRWCDFL